MVSIDPTWIRPVETMELVELSRHDIFERTNEGWVEDDTSQWVTKQVRSDVALMFR